jgi:hypothetical protein
MPTEPIRSALTIPAYLLGAAALAACGGNGSTGSFPGGCFVGQPVVVPSADATDPTVTLSFFLPDGTTVTAPAGQGTTDVLTPPGEVVISAVARDPEGVRDVQLWVASRSCTMDPSAGTATCSGPGLLGAPTASNRDATAAGGNGCTERLATQNVDVVKSPTRDVSFEVHARGENFGSATVSTGLIRLRAP